MYWAVERIGEFAGEDPGTWSLLVGTVVAIGAATVGGASVLVAGTWWAGVDPGLVVRFLVGTVTVAGGVGVGAWYLVVERRDAPGRWRGGLAGAIAGVLAGPVAWFLLGGWWMATVQSGPGLTLGEVLAGYRSFATAPSMRVVVLVTVAGPICAVAGMVGARIRRSVAGEANDAEVARSLARE